MKNKHYFASHYLGQDSKRLAEKDVDRRAEEWLKERKLEELERSYSYQEKNENFLYPRIILTIIYK